jgi:hypothetical protein
MPPNLRAYAFCAHASLADDRRPALETVHVDLHEPDDAWKAKDARQWAMALAPKADPPPPLNLRDATRSLYHRSSDCAAVPVGERSFSSASLMTLLCGLYEHARCRALAILSDDDGHRQIDWAAIIALVRFSNTFLPRLIKPSDDASRWQHVELMLTWNTRCISSLLGVDLLEGTLRPSSQTPPC